MFPPHYLSSNSIKFDAVIFEDNKAASNGGRWVKNWVKKYFIVFGHSFSGGSERFGWEQWAKNVGIRIYIFFSFQNQFDLWNCLWTVYGNVMSDNEWRSQIWILVARWSQVQKTNAFASPSIHNLAYGLDWSSNQWWKYLSCRYRCAIHKPLGTMPKSLGIQPKSLGAIPKSVGTSTKSMGILPKILLLKQQ